MAGWRGGGVVVVWWPIRFETAPSPNSFFPFLFDFGLGLGLVKNSVLLTGINIYLILLCSRCLLRYRHHKAVNIFLELPVCVPNVHLHLWMMHFHQLSPSQFSIFATKWHKKLTNISQPNCAITLDTSRGKLRF